MGRFPCHGSKRAGRLRGALVGSAALVVLPPVLAACGSSSTAGVSSSGVVAVVAAENQYGNVASQIGGRYAQVSSVVSNPNTDPHSYEVSPSVANAVAGAALVIQNGAGYDAYMDKVESASPNSNRKVVDVQRLLGLPDDTPNPHLWYDPRTMPAVAGAIGSDLAALDPEHVTYFRANVTKFDASLQPWLDAITAFKAQHAGTAAATTEPVADSLLSAMGIDNLTPFAFQADVMNGTDPAPQDIARGERLLLQAPGRPVRLQPTGRRHTDPIDPVECTTGGDSGGGRLRDHADPRLHLPVVDAGRNERDPSCRRARHLHSPSVTTVLETERSTGDEPVLAVEGVSVVLSGRRILQDVNFTLAPGEFAGLIGSNGAGKTTLLRVILGLQRPSAGRVRTVGINRKHAIGYVPQKVLLDPDLPMRARDLVELGADGHRFGLPIHPKHRRQRVEELLEAVGAESFANARVGRLSGGEQQRVLVAHALASRPRVLLLDEPLANLDLRSADEIVSLLDRIATEQGVAVLVSAHEINALLPAMDRVVYLADGRAATGTTDEVVRGDVLSNLYGHHVDVVRIHGRILVVVGPRPSDREPIPPHPPIEVS